PPRWGVSSLDYHTHAIDPDAEHPDAVYVARCGQLLFRDATLYDEPPPGGSMCPACAGRGPRWITTRTCFCLRVTTPRTSSRPGAAR
ncbi:MAG: hypothetical protein ACRDQ9_19945, partial [Pseudonocardiaceae bacterium]